MTFLEVFEMDSKSYDRLKYVVQIILPAIATFIGVLGLALDFPSTDLIVTITTAVITLLGTMLGISNYQYKQNL